MTRRLQGLEAVRGVAALMVAYDHAGLIAGHPSFASRLYDESYLGVDLFFLLSGFVIARTYEHRMPPAGAFLKLRFARLWPPVACGVLLGACYFALTGMGWSDLALNLAAGLVILPVVRQTILFNPPAWSIYFELFANLGHAAALKFLTNRCLMLLAGVCAALLWAGTGEAGLHVGFTDSFWLGFPRVLLSYSLGILLWRISGDRPLVPARLAWPAIAAYALVLAAYPASLEGAAEILFVTIVNPLAMLAALSMRDSGAAALLGAYSFPLYATHYPLQMLAFALGAPWWSALAVSLVVAAGLGLVVDPRMRDRVRRQWRGVAGAELPLRT